MAIVVTKRRLDTIPHYNNVVTDVSAANLKYEDLKGKPTINGHEIGISQKGVDLGLCDQDDTQVQISNLLLITTRLVRKVQEITHH